MKKTTLFLGSVVLAMACSSPSPTKEDALGELTFNVTGSEAANVRFIKGHLLMHSFEYDDAADAFREAIKEDPSCVMAYWGEAMTYNHPIWQEQDYEAGKAALTKLGPTHEDRIKKTSSDLEKDLLEAVDILYGEGTKPERDSLYANFMGSLYAKYPNNHEVASLYALSLLGSVQVGRDDEVYQQSARISESILKENPNHPGALHYLIHADDDPVHAEKALSAADKYAVVAPDASHALHMPTHIFVALGMWDRVIALNEQSWESSVERKEAKGLSNDDLGYHSFHWLQYGYLQKGRKDDARKLLDRMKMYCDEHPSSRARAHKILMRSTYLVESGDWLSEISSDTTDHRNLSAYIQTKELFTRAMQRLYHEDLDSMDVVISQIKNLITIESATINRDGIAICKSGALSPSGTTQLDIDQSLVMQWELEGLKAWAKREYENAEQLFKKAADLEQNISYSYGPPAVVKPSSELYGEFLLERNRPAEAIKAFNASLHRAPGRRLSLEGKVKAARMLKLDKVVNEVEKELAGV
jgi:tetratricopeptide (TPR) repeat protein